MSPYFCCQSLKVSYHLDRCITLQSATIDGFISCWPIGRKCAQIADKWVGPWTWWKRRMRGATSPHKYCSDQNRRCSPVRLAIHRPQGRRRAQPGSTCDNKRCRFSARCRWIRRLPAYMPNGTLGSLLISVVDNLANSRTRLVLDLDNAGNGV